jgi:tRNA U34 5-methylaminomethyl-2-thiouridine-forming methyltransferase MnmC
MPTIVTSDGSHTIFSETYGVTYHSKYGAVTESAHVFIAAGLRYKAVVQRDIAILEIGLGTGLNAMMTWLEAEKRGLSVAYTGVEMYPVDGDTLAALNYPELLGIPDRADDFTRMHTCRWSRAHRFSDVFSFTKIKSPIETYTAEQAYDLIYFDAFAPQAQPELWTVAVFEHMYAALRPDGVLVTYCAQGEFKRSLKKAGFTVEALQGPPGKREMTRAFR